MKEFEYNKDDNRFTCCINEELGGIEITGFRGNGARIELPESISHEGTEWEIRGIGKKAFLGCQTVRSVVLPNTVRKMDDWAFSQCRQLEGVKISGEEEALQISLGTGVFADCPGIRYVAMGVEETDDLAVLLAATINQLPSEDLLRDAELGGEHWYQKWDQRLQTFLNEDDEEGYTSMVLCGEEDIKRNVPEYAADKRRRKAWLCMLRLMHDSLLTQELKQVYTDYLLTHTKGSETEEAWEVIVLEHGEDMACYQLLADIGGIHADNIDAMVQDLDAAHAEAKAFLIRYKQEHFAVSDIFDMFSL